MRQVGKVCATSSRRSRSDRGSLSTLHLVLALLVLSLLVGATTALAEEGDEAPSLPTAGQVTDAIASGSQAIPSLEPDLALAEELPHENLGREEALELLEGVFTPQLEAPAGIFDDLDVERFLAPDVAVLSEPEGSAASSGPDGEGGLLAGTVLLDSTVPLRAETPSGEADVVDLSLEPSEGELQPANPLSEVGIPKELDEGIELPGPGVTIRLADAPNDRATSVTEQSVGFVPNVATDTDLAIAPTLTGVETLTHLRTPDAPHTQTFNLQLPPGATLEATDNGGAAVMDGNEMLVGISPPVAIDAAGEDVPVSLEIAGSTFTLTASPDDSTIYPILVDPLFQTYDWAKSKHGENGLCSSSFKWENPKPCNYREEWGHELIKKPASTGTLSITHGYWNSTGPVPYNTPGIGLLALGALTAGDRAAMLYTVPRYFTEMDKPTSYISAMNLTNLDWSVGSNQASPYVFTGIWDPINTGWISYYTHESLQGHGVHDWNYPYNFSNPTNDNGKVGYVSIQVTETQPWNSAQLWVGYASMQLSDLIAPSMGSVSFPSWVDQTPAPATYTAGDSGLGVHSLVATDEAISQHSWKTTHGCIGVSGSPCPRWWKSTESQLPKLSYDPSVISQGINYLNVRSEDPIGNKSPVSSAEVKVDHSKPTLALSGTMTEQEKVGTTAGAYTLKYEAADGDSAAAAAQDPLGTAGTSEGQLQRPMGVSVDPSGNTWVVDRECKCVQKYDPAGNFALQWNKAGPFWNEAPKFSDPRGIATSSVGDVWVTDLANKQVYQLSSTGNILRVINYSGFVEPYAVAPGPGNVVWVSDIGTDKLYKFTSGSSTPTLAFGTKANPTGQNLDLLNPVGLDVDDAGTLWVADNGLNRITAYNSNRQWVAQFGTTGAGNGQLSGPVGIAAAPASGNILVADANNNRVQEFRQNGEYIRQFATGGSAKNQLSEPRGLSLGPNKAAYIADSANKRIAKWTHGTYDPQSGVAKTEVTVDGVLAESPHAPGCATKDCAVNREWTLDADDYAVGYHTVKVTATDSVGISAHKSVTIETHGDLMPPAVALSGSMTEQATLGTTRPAYALKVNATDPGGAEERKSGVAATTIKVDGNVVDTTSPGCAAGGCSINREWTLNSSSYSVGNHSVQVTATDAAGRATTKSLAITIDRDTTPPEITTTGIFNALFNRPEGWVEQKNYIYNPTATDVGGYGVTSLAVKFDGAQIMSKTQGCSLGGCQTNALGQLNMINYDGGAHTAEVIATDGAGNTRKRSWTINVDPAGQISVGEAEDTLEAVEATTPANLIGESRPEESLEGTGIDIGVESSGSDIEATGTAIPIVISSEPGDAVELEVLESESPSEECSASAPEDEFAAQISTACDEPVGDSVADTEDDYYDEISVTPLGTAEAASNNVPTGAAGGSDTATVATNTSGNVDSIHRPLYEGLITFKAIRDVSATDTFSWRVQLDPGQELKRLDPEHAQVIHEGGRPAFTITAEPAHDAVGSNVPVTLSVSGDVVTLLVNHRAASYVYPVVSGTAWQGGFVSTEIDGPMDEQEIKEEEERIAREEQELREAEEAAEPGEEIDGFTIEDGIRLQVRASSIGPPLWNGGSTPARRFRFSECQYYVSPGDIPKVPVPKRRPWAAIMGSCLRAERDEALKYGMTVRGWFHVSPGKWVWVNEKPADQLECVKWGPRKPAMVHCFAKPDKAKEGITVRGDFRAPVELGNSLCHTVYGTLHSEKPYKRLQESIVTLAHVGIKDPPEPCDWPG